MILVSCNNKKNNNLEANKTNYNISQTRKTTPRKKIIRVELNYLPKVLESHDSLYSAFQKYLNCFNLEINNEENIIAIFNKRDSLLQAMHKQIDNYYYNENDDNFLLWDKIDAELKSVGFMPIYAEGGYIALDVSPILTDEIDTIASEAFKLSIYFNNEYAKTLGGEYPFFNTDAFFSTYLIGEELLKKHPKSKYYSKIKDKFHKIINYITDVHLVSELDDGSYNCECFGFSYSYYPYSTNCEAMADFIKNHSNAIISPVLKKLIKNKSEIIISYDNDIKANIFVIVTDETTSLNNAYNKAAEYILDGKDYVHSLHLKKDGKDKYYVAYRYYTDEERASVLFEKIKKAKPNAKLLHLVLKKEFSPAEIID